MTEHGITAREVAAGVVAEVGRARGLAWAIGLLREYGWRETPSVAMLAAAVMLA